MKTETLGPIRILRALDGRHATVRHGGQSTRIINHNDPVEVERMIDAELDYLRGEARETLAAIDARQLQRAAAAHPGPAVAAGDYGQPPTPPKRPSLEARVRELEIDVEGLWVGLRELRNENQALCALVRKLEESK